MKFYLGIHLPYIAQKVKRAFISVNVLKRRKSDFAVNDWILDSGAFTEISTYGQYRHSVSDYACQINRWATCGNLELAVAQDYMCEPFIVAKTGMTVTQHQKLTVERYIDLIAQLTRIPIMPVLQGYAIVDYVKHLEMYGDLLADGMRVGVGSICKRNGNPRQIANVLEAIKRERPDLKLHGFGLKTTSLKNNYIVSLLYSADSMAWSFSARKQGRNPNSADEALSFEKRILNTQSQKTYQFALEGSQCGH